MKELIKKVRASKNPSLYLLMHFVWNYQGELTIKLNKAYHNGYLVAEYSDGELIRYKKNIKLAKLC